MSLVWTLIASFLYLEIAIVLLLVLPLASPMRWQKLFRSRFMAMLSKQAQVYFYMLLAVLFIFVLEALREMNKYSHHDANAEASLNVGLQHNLRLFRSQRNFYISGFAIFLVLVIRRLVSLISAQAQLLAQSEAAMKQAKGASDAARTLMSQQAGDKKTDNKKGATEAAAEGKDTVDETMLKALKETVAKLESELKKERKDKEALKSQAESLNREYDRLTEEYSKLERKVTLTTKSD